MDTLGFFVRSIGMILAERRSFRSAARFAARALRHPGPTGRLLRYVWRDEGRTLPRPVRVDILMKVGRQHVRIGLSASDRANLLIAHHAALRRAMRRDVLEAFLGGAAIRLAGIEGRDGADAFEVLLYRAPFGYRREGEATLSVRSRDSFVRLADVTFTIGGTAAAATCLRVGGVQGPPAPHGKDAVKAATKALDGLRPKAVAIEALYQLARGFGVGTVYATSLSRHVLRGTRKGPLIHAGPYDTFWEELGGLRLADGDYLLPREPPHRDPAEVPAKRRKEWERRQSRIATLAANIGWTMADLAEPPPPLPFGQPRARAELAELLR
jgi:hypothetical protein